MDNSKIVVCENLWTAPFVYIILINFFTYLGNFMLMSTLPLHILNIGGKEILAGLITGIYSLTGLLVRLQIGKLLDKKERKIIMLGGLTVLLLVILSYNIVAYSIPLLFILRAIHGVGWSTATTSTGTIASDIIPATRRNEGMGYFSVSISIAMIFGPGLGLYMLEHYNHIFLFLISAVFILLALLAGLKKSEYSSGEFGVIKPISGKLTKIEAGQNKKTAAIERTALWPSFIFFIIVMTYTTIMIFLPPYARDKGVADISTFFIVMALAMVLTRITTGRIADRYGISKVIVAGMVLIAVALQILSFAASLSIFLISAVIYGFGYGAVQPALNALVISLAPVERRGAANATFLGSMDMAGIIGAIVWGIVAQAFGFMYIYSASVILVLISIALYFIAFKSKHLLPNK